MSSLIGGQVRQKRYDRPIKLSLALHESYLVTLYLFFSSSYPVIPLVPTGLIALQELTMYRSYQDPTLVQWLSRLPLTLHSFKLLGLCFDIRQLSSLLNPVLSHLINVHIEMPTSSYYSIYVLTSPR